MILLLLFVVSFLVILMSGLNFWKDVTSSKVPGPRPIPILGNGHLFLGNSAKFLECLGRLGSEFGNVFRIYVLSKRYFVITNPKYVEALTSSTELITKGRSYHYLHPWLGSGLLTSNGLRWKTHRKFLTPAFHFNILQNFLPVFLKTEKILVEKLHKISADGKTFDLFPVIALAALDNVTESIMGVTVNAQTDHESKYVKAIDELSKLTSMRMRNPLLAEDAVFNLTPHKTIQTKALEILHGQTRAVIKARREELKQLNITKLNYDSDHGIKNKYAFLDLLLLAEIDGQKVDDKSVREEVDTFMFEGHDTTTSGIVFSLYCLSRYQDVQAKILQEQTDILGDDIKRDPTYSEINQMKYLELVIKESLRLYPSVPMIERYISRDTDLAGMFIPKDTSILVDILHMQRHPDVFENPLEFRPERFEKTLNNNPFHWVVFSAGPRNCIGQKFAMLEMKVVLSSIVRSFKILPSGTEPVLSADLILRSLNGVHVNFVKRE